MLNVLQAEIKHEKEQYESPVELKKFLQDGPWKMEDVNGDVNMALLRTVDGKTVKIEWQLSSPFDPNTEGADDAEPAPDSTDFSVTIEEPKGSGVVFYCSTQTGQDHRFVIGNVSRFSSPEQRDSASTYNGPEFEDLDDKLQEAFDEYLAEMGMGEDVCDFIDASASDKEQREYIAWLNGVKAFVE